MAVFELEIKSPDNDGGTSISGTLAMSTQIPHFALVCPPSPPFEILGNMYLAAWLWGFVVRLELTIELTRDIIPDLGVRIGGLTPHTK